MRLIAVLGEIKAHFNIIMRNAWAILHNSYEGKAHGTGNPLVEKLYSI